MAKCIEDSRSCWRASSESTSVGIEVWNYVRRQPLMQTNHVESTGGIRNYPILGKGEGRGGVCWWQLLFGGPTSTQRKFCGFLTPVLLEKLTKISLRSTKTLSKTRLTILWLKVELPATDTLPLVRIKSFNKTVKREDVTWLLLAAY